MWDKQVREAGRARIALDQVYKGATTDALPVSSGMLDALHEAAKAAEDGRQQAILHELSVLSRLNGKEKQ